MEQENLEENIGAEQFKKAKKKKAMIMAAVITFFIFSGWIFYFIGNTKKQIAKDKGVALFENLKQNSIKPLEEMKTFWANIKEKFFRVKGSYEINQNTSAASTGTK